MALDMHQENTHVIWKFIVRISASNILNL